MNEALVELGLEARCEVVGVPDRFIEHGDQASQQEEAGISAGRIAARVREAVGRREITARGDRGGDGAREVGTTKVAGSPAAAAL